ncbi:unnamed protein product [Trichogramma brassicae]|uniref:alanine--tRNA ligase n=1 Tax=Trichogramma brassicae TaxID=86971 RepID=A0A6H5I383_9HYME|nr:unnamed protein product [Trichogramma brassicae]
MNNLVLFRALSTEKKSVKSSKVIRQEFLNYFIKQNNHAFVRSSPVMPLNDPTIPFVNAGMNQFKGVLLGHHDAPAFRVANSQKCIRVGGKHNDYDTVGLDSYHHTFFEMLGNWSFGDYFKEDACRYAWDLLVNVYGIKKEFLYVTYFGGNEKFNLKPDLECKEIWLNIGVPEDKIIPFGMTENFWEMGPTGPCGSCTEIHIDQAMQEKNQASRVNKGHDDVTELWNIVFIQYQSHKLRRILRKAIDISEDVFKNSSLLSELTNHVADNLGDFYPEIHQNLNKIQYIIKYEEQVMKSARQAALKNWKKVVNNRPELSEVPDATLPGLSAGYYELQNLLKSKAQVNGITGEFAFKLYDTYGLNVDTISKLAEIESIPFDPNNFKMALEKAKKQSRGSSVSDNGLDFECSTFGKKLTLKEVIEIENYINETIKANVTVKTKTVNLLQMLKENNLTVIPGEVYPENGIKIVEINSEILNSKEACCGTHLHKTGTLEDFCIVNLKSQGASSIYLKALTGPAATLAKLSGENLKDRIFKYENILKSNKVDLKDLELKILSERQKLLDKNKRVKLPYVIVQQSLIQLENLLKIIKSEAKGITRSSIEEEIKKLLDSSSLPFVVHFLQPNNATLENVSLKNIIKLCPPTTPVFVIIHCDNKIKARCVVPPHLQSSEFNAKMWMEEVLRIFQTKGSTFRDDDPQYAYNMSPTHISNDNFKSLIDKAISSATKFASIHVKSEK